MTYTQQYYRHNYFPDNLATERLLERYRLGHLKQREEIDAVFVWASEQVHQFARRYYKQEQNTSRWEWYQLHGIEDEHDRHQDRVLYLLDMLRDERYYERSAMWILAAYKRRFAQIEALLQLRNMGVGMYDWTIDDHNDELSTDQIHEQHIAVITFVYASKLERSILNDGNELSAETVRNKWVETELKYGRNPSEVRWKNFLKKYGWFKSIQKMSSRKPYRVNDLPSQTY